MTSPDLSAPGGLAAPDATRELIRAYRQRITPPRQRPAGHGPLVGCLGHDVPIEILIAAGYQPVRVCGDPDGSAAAADRYLERAFDPLVRAQFARIVGGAYAHLDHLVISNSADALIRVFYYLRALRRSEPQLPIPPVYFFDFLHSSDPASARYNLERVRDLQLAAESWSGRAITPERFAAAMAACNEVRRLQRQLAALRRGPVLRISGTEAIQVLGASLYMPLDQYARLLRAFLAGIERRPPLTAARVFLSGSPHDHERVYQLVEDCGATIVGEDHHLGLDLSAGEMDPAAEPTAAIAGWYQRRPLRSSQATVSQRVAELTAQVRAAGARGVIFYILDRDDAPAWDFPEQQRALAQLGIPILLLDRQPYRLENPTELRRRVAAFLAGLGAGGSEQAPGQRPGPERSGHEQ